MRSRKIAVENVNKPGREVRVDAEKYEAARAAILAALPSSLPGLTLAELKERFISRLPETLFPRGAKAGWWLMALQLDLRAKKLIECDMGKPMRFYRSNKPGV